MADAIKNLSLNSLSKLSRSEQTMLKEVDTLWAKNYNAKEHMPESNTTRPASRKRSRKKKTRTQEKPTTANKPNSPKEDNDQFVEAHTLDDKECIIYRICIPPIKPHWQCRTFDLKVKAVVCKLNLIQPLINWKLLDSIMELPQDEGTAIFQDYVDTSLEQ